MSSDHGNENKRCESRFPVFEQVGWQKMDSPELETCELIDVSRTGLSFRVPIHGDPPLYPGDEISVRRLGQHTCAAQYTVVWEQVAKDSVSVGCTRLSPTDVSAGPRSPSFNLVVARFHRNEPDWLNNAPLPEPGTVVTGTRIAVR